MKIKYQAEDRTRNPPRTCCSACPPGAADYAISSNPVDSSTPNVDQIHDFGVSQRRRLESGSAIFRIRRRARRRAREECLTKGA